jgi:hypothetical protein
MSKLRRFVVASLVLGLLAVAVIGAGWKWSHGHDGYGPQKLAGWTWDAGTTIPANPGNGNAYGQANNNNNNSNPNNNTDPNNNSAPTP